MVDSLARTASLVLVAPPGAGKTTRVPPALSDAPWLGDRKIVVLEPRRLATRAAARRMAAERGERVGESVGYRMRLDTVVGPRTRIEVVTEGVLTRMLREDPTLADVGAVLFDEFHERSLHADLGLALARHAQRLVRDDLRLVIMSATLDGDAIARSLGAPVLRSEGRSHPVETRYRPMRDRERPDAAIARIVREAIDSDTGDILVFLPGAAEIRRLAEALDRTPADARVDIRPLYGDLSGADQDAAIAPGPPGRRKVVLATNIAETSLTIDGVRVVVDAGTARVPRFSPRTGLTRLETVRISRASADQRRGRAGRTAPGVCYRLWSEADDAQLAPRNVPEILDADLAPLALELAAAGIADPAALEWIDPPAAGGFAQARALLARLGALAPGDDGGTSTARLTPHGRAMADLPAHPRLAHMLLRGHAAGHGALACDLAAVLANRDIVRPPMPGEVGDADVRTRLDILRGRPAPPTLRVDRDGLRRVRDEAREWRARLGVPADALGDADAAGLLVSLAYPDRIGRMRAEHPGRFLLASGTGAHFHAAQPLGGEAWLAVAETEGRAPEARIYLAAPAALDDLLAEHHAQVTTDDDVSWDAGTGRVLAVRRTRLGEIVVREQHLRDVAPSHVRAALVGEVRRRGIGALPWEGAARALRQRLAFLRHHDASARWPATDDATLDATLDAWLGPHLEHPAALRDMTPGALHDALASIVDWRLRRELDALAPTHLQVPTGSRIAIDYANPEAPVLAVRLQELFGQRETPTVFDGRVPVTLHLLSPAGRPVQVTRDLGAFWRGSYADVRKEMRGRYPKHDWPDDPLVAAPSRGHKRRR